MTSLASASAARKKKLIDRISTFSETEQVEIFKLLVRNGVPYTSNRNGVFINMTHVAPELYGEIESCVEFYARNKVALDEFEQRLSHEYKHAARSDDAASTAVAARADGSNVGCGGPSSPPTAAVNKAYDALLSQVAIVAQNLKPRQVSKYTLARKRFAKKQQPSSCHDPRARCEFDADELLDPEPYIIGSPLHG